MMRRYWIFILPFLLSPALAAEIPLPTPAPTNDPCMATFKDIATALEAGKLDQAAGYFQFGSRAATTVRAIGNDTAAAKNLAQTFRGAVLKTAIDGGATYTSSWVDPSGKTLDLEIGAQTGLFGCVVAAW